MKFVVDMNLSPAWVELLNSARHDAVHWSHVGRNDASDPEIMQWAAENGRVIITSDLDFGAILAGSGDRHPSVIQLRSEDLRPAQVGATVLAAVSVAKADLEAGALLTIDAARSRLHVLPFIPRL